MATNPAKESIVSPPTKEIKFSYREELKAIAALEDEGLLSGARLERRQEAADARYEAGMEDRRKSKAVLAVELQATPKLRKEKSLMQDLSDQSDSGEDEAQPRKRRKAAPRSKSTAKSCKASVSKSVGRKTWATDLTGGQAHDIAKNEKGLSISQWKEQFVDCITTSQTTIHYQYKSGSKEGQYGFITVPCKFKDKQGVERQVYLCAEDKTETGDGETANNEDSETARTPSSEQPTTGEAWGWKAVEFSCTCCSFGYINGLGRSLQSTKDYLRNHNKWCAPHHDGLVKLLPKDLIPAEAEYISWAELPSNKTRQNKYRKSKEQGGVSATEEAMLEDSGLVDDLGVG